MHQAPPAPDAFQHLPRLPGINLASYAQNSQQPPFPRKSPQAAFTRAQAGTNMTRSSLAAHHSTAARSQPMGVPAERCTSSTLSCHGLSPAVASSRPAKQPGYARPLPSTVSSPTRTLDRSHQRAHTRSHGQR
jgi:hypothetical protein